MSTESKSKIKLTVEAFGETTTIEREAAFVVAFDEVADGEFDITSCLLGNTNVSSLAESIVSALDKQGATLGYDLKKAVSTVLALVSLKDIIESMGDEECDCPKCRAEREPEGE